MSKAISNKLKTALPTLISSQQIAFVKNRFIGESGRLISSIIEISGCFNITGFLVTMDIEKAFDSLDHRFLISVLKKFGFWKNFITWIEILLKDQQLCVINGGTTIQYFNLERDARQGDPVSVYLFILMLEILFLFIQKHPEIKGIEIFEHCFFYTAYADETTFFLKDAQSIENLVEILNTFSLFPGLKPYLTKWEIARIRARKGVQVTVCGMRCIDLCNEAFKNFGTYFSYSRKIKEECNFLKIVSNV